MTVFDQFGYYEKYKKQNEIFQTIGFMLLWDFWMFCQILLSPQVKRCAIITY